MSTTLLDFLLKRGKRLGKIPMHQPVRNKSRDGRRCVASRVDLKSTYSLLLSISMYFQRVVVGCPRVPLLFDMFTCCK